MAKIYNIQKHLIFNFAGVTRMWGGCMAWLVNTVNGDILATLKYSELGIWSN